MHASIAAAPKGPHPRRARAVPALHQPHVKRAIHPFMKNQNILHSHRQRRARGSTDQHGKARRGTDTPPRG
eukprot:1396840-Prymnesium_polylepis.1